MTMFLVETYTPATIKVAAVEERARVAARQVAEAGGDVEYVGSIFLPEDELCMYLFDAASKEAVNEVALSAGISPDRIARTAS